MSTTETKYVWVLIDISSVEVFIGFDHIRRCSKSYKSSNDSKMIDLANQIANQHQIEIIQNYSNN